MNRIQENEVQETTVISPPPTGKATKPVDEQVHNNLNPLYTQAAYLVTYPSTDAASLLGATPPPRPATEETKTDKTTRSRRRKDKVKVPKGKVVQDKQANPLQDARNGP